MSGLTALMIFASACAGSPGSAETAEAAGPDGTTYILTVEGMSCAENCAPRVKECLESIEGVKSAEVTFEEKRAVVVMEKGRELTSEAADKSFGNEGYFVSEISAKAPPAEAEDDQATTH
jgi:copper chaperone CopZ